jgi:glycosyltransferase involved in cell wall biosynthesis
MSFTNIPMSLKISIIVPTYNSMFLLKQTLDSFKNQSIGKDHFEIIVVDDGSKDGSKYLVDEYRNIVDISYYYLEDKGFRLAAARNVGIHFAKYPVTLIFDCGMLASNALLEQHLKIHHDYHNGVVVGMSYGVEEFSMANAASLAKVLDENNLNNAFSFLRSTARYNDCRFEAFSRVGFDLSNTKTSWVACWGGHISCRTNILRDLNGFDEWFDTWGGEDVELAIRLHIKGCEFLTLQSMEAIHVPHIRREENNINSSKENIKYITGKHNYPDVALLENFGWEEIFNRGSMK